MDLLATITDMISKLVNFLISIVNNFVSLLEMIPKFLTYLTTMGGLLPSMLVPFVIASLSLYVLFLIIDR